MKTNKKLMLIGIGIMLIGALMFGGVLSVPIGEKIGVPETNLTPDPNNFVKANYIKQTFVPHKSGKLLDLKLGLSYDYDNNPSIQQQCDQHPDYRGGVEVIVQILESPVYGEYYNCEFNKLGATPINMLSYTSKIVGGDPFLEEGKTYTILLTSYSSYSYIHFSKENYPYGVASEHGVGGQVFEKDIAFDVYVESEINTGYLKGYVTKEDGTGIGAFISASGDVYAETSSNSNGYYEFELTPGIYNVYFDIDLYLWEDNRIIQVESGKTTWLNMTAERPEIRTCIKGHVTDAETGTAIERALVALRSSRWNYAFYTDVNGDYEYCREEWTISSESVEVQIWSEGYYTNTKIISFEPNKIVTHNVALLKVPPDVTPPPPPDVDVTGEIDWIPIGLMGVGGVIALIGYRRP